MDAMIQAYREALDTHGPGPEAVMWPKGRQELRFAALLSGVPSTGNVHVLDFGSGLGDLLTYIKQSRPNLACSYVGVEVVPEFRQVAYERHPEGVFVDSIQDLGRGYTTDYVVASGPFNYKYCADTREHEESVFDIIRRLYLIAKTSISVDFMRSNVDYKQPHSHHQSIDSLARFVESHLTRNYWIDATYLPYEFCIHIIKPEGT